MSFLPKLPTPPDSPIKPPANLVLYNDRSPFPPPIDCKHCIFFSDDGKIRKCSAVQVTPNPSGHCIIYAPNPSVAPIGAASALNDRIARFGEQSIPQALTDLSSTATQGLLANIPQPLGSVQKAPASRREIAGVATQKTKSAKFGQ